jgi:hypothetical protein
VQAIDLTVMMALSTIASEQAQSTKNTMQKNKQLLGYLAAHSDATVQFYATDMILNIHSNAFYLSKANTHSRACRHFFMGWTPNPTQPIELNGAFFYLVCNIMVYCCIHCGGRTWCIVFKLQGSHNILTHS